MLAYKNENQRCNISTFINNPTIHLPAAIFTSILHRKRNQMYLPDFPKWHVEYENCDSNPSCCSYNNYRLRVLLPNTFWYAFVFIVDLKSIWKVLLYISFHIVFFDNCLPIEFKTLTFETTMTNKLNLLINSGKR